MRTLVVAVACALLPAALAAQPSWHAAAAPPRAPLDLFHAIGLPDLPTTQTLGRGDFHFEISHRFAPTIDEGVDAAWGLDGPVFMRLAVGYGVSDRLMLTLGRSIVLDNLDLQATYRLTEFDNDAMPSAVAVRLGVAWNTDMPAVVDRDRLDADNFQYIAQGVWNSMLLDGKLGLGLVPSYVNNSAIFSVQRRHTFTLGTYAQYFVDRAWSLWAEYSPALSGYQGILLPGETGRSHDSLALGTALETGGHVFYLFVTNNTRLNASQYLVGAPSGFSTDNLHLAFAIHRHL